MLTRNLTSCYNLKIFLRNLKGTNKWRDLKDWKLNKTKYFRLRLCVSKCNAPVILLKIAWRPFWDHLMYAESPFELWYLSKKDIIWERKERKKVEPDRWTNKRRLLFLELLSEPKISDETRELIIWLSSIIFLVIISREHYFYLKTTLN